jgi:hypothetical protein
MNLPWWGWLLIGLWCLPGVYATFGLLLQKPMGGLDENGKPFDAVPLPRRLIVFPLVLVLLVVVWPQEYSQVIGQEFDGHRNNARW